MKGHSVAIELPETGVPAEQDDAAALRDALAAAGDIAYVWDIASDRLDFIGDLASLFGPGYDGAVRDGETFQARLNPEDTPHRQRVLSDRLADGGRFDCEYRVRRSDGDFCWVHERGRVMAAADGSGRRLTGTLRVVTERKAAEESTGERAVYDAVTGHFNLSRLREALDHALSHARRYDTVGGYLVVGVDDLAAINEEYGRARADAALAAVGRRLEDTLRSADLIGRIRGGRIGVVLERCGADGLRAAAEKVIAAVAAAPAATPQGDIALTVSVGGVTFPGSVRTAPEAMDSADAVLRAARRKGRSRFALYEPTAAQQMRARAQENLGRTLLDALRDARAILAYQPVVRSADRHIAYYETLLRVPGQDEGFIAAAVPAAEKLGYARRIDRWVLDAAVAELVIRPDLALAVNISGLTATDRSWLRRLTSLVTGQPALAGRLIVEITETAALYDFEESARFIAAVRELGCRVALDDFGVGHTSFRRLKSFAVDIVKIDGSFVRGVAGNTENQRFIAALLDVARAFGIDTVAECVESEADYAYLLGRSVDYMQGWMFGRAEAGPPAVIAGGARE